jgi:hypothetical protein
VTRIWEAVQALSANLGKRAAHVAPAKGKPKKNAQKDRRRHTARAAAKDTARIAREGSKKGEVIELMRRSQGAAPSEIMN